MTSAKDVEQKLTHHFQEAHLPQRRITDILEQATNACSKTNNRGVLEELNYKLRAANQNLLIATFNAQDMQAAAEAANRAKEEFLSMLAHELRNPLAPIAMATTMLGKMVNIHPDLPKLHGIIERQGRHLVRLVDDLLDASRVSSRKITLEMHRVLLSSVLESAIEISQPFIDKSLQLLHVDVPSEPVVINGDLIRLSQLFANLLLNASKFTPERGNISISANAADCHVTISLKDDGVGISAELLPTIFDLFAQGPRALDRSQGGLGIGLSLVRTIAEMHGGSVDVRSDGAGLGSEFIVILPLSNALPLTDATAVIEKPSPRQILLIDDNADSNYILNELLSLEGNTVVSALDGIGGLAMAKADSFDVVVCDIGLPGLDGYEVISQLRQQPGNPQPIFIALTGYDQPESRLKAIAAGFDHYLVKPIDVDVLSNIFPSKAGQ